MTKAATAAKPPSSPAAAVRPTPSEAKQLLAGPVDLAKIAVFSNVRKHFDEKDLKELADNIKTVGLINPIILRPNGKPGHYFLVAGERRLRAAKLAGFKEIPARVLDLGEEQALELQAAENLQRKDLTAIEEARAFQTLTKSGRYSVEDLAKRVDKSLAYVYRSVRLLELAPKFLDLVEKGELTAAHGHQLLRVHEGKREAAWKEWTEGHGYLNGAVGAKDLGLYIDDYFGEALDSAIFPKTREYAGAQACTGCPHNSSNQGALFDGIEKGKCTFKGCFETKTNTAKAELVDKLKKDNPAARFVEFARGYVTEGTMRTGGFVVRGVFEKAPKDEFGILIESQSLKQWIATKETAKEVSKSEASKPKPRSEKDVYVDSFLEENLREAAFKTLRAAGEKDLLGYLQKRWHERDWRRDEIRKTLGVEARKIKTLEVLRAAVLFEDQDSSGTIEEFIDDLGGEAKKLTAQLTKDAVAAYEKDKAASDAKAAKDPKKK